MTKRATTASLLELAEAKAVKRAKCWMDLISMEERDEILSAARELRKKRLPIFCLAEILVEKYDLNIQPESIVRTITRRIEG